MSGARQLRAMLAALVLLLHALLPGLHAWEHAVEAADERSAPCADCGRLAVDAGGSAPANRAPAGIGAPANEHCHQHGDECSLCVAIQLDRNVPLPTSMAVVQTLGPPRGALLVAAAARVDVDLAFGPPARAPPLLLG